MKLFCEVYVRNILPTLRALISENLLNNYSISQYQISKSLGVTHAAVNQYIKRKRGAKLIKILKESPELMEYIHEVSKNLYESNLNEERMMKILCESCIYIRSTPGLLDKLLSEMNIERRDIITPNCRSN
jgi:predicted transcriptional regulator